MVRFKKGQLQVLAHGWDRDLGGRDFDEVLFDYWCAEFDAKFRLNVRSSPRASFRLRLACEKASRPVPQRPAKPYTLAVRLFSLR